MACMRDWSHSVCQVERLKFESIGKWSCFSTCPQVFSNLHACSVIDRGCCENGSAVLNSSFVNSFPVESEKKLAKRHVQKKRKRIDSRFHCYSRTHPLFSSQMLPPLQLQVYFPFADAHMADPLHSRFVHRSSSADKLKRFHSLEIPKTAFYSSSYRNPMILGFIGARSWHCLHKPSYSYG